MSIVRKENHSYPHHMADEAAKALSHFPELRDTVIHFTYSHIKVQSFMLAQPVISTLWRSKRRRHYRILVKRSLVVNNPNFSQKYPKYDVLVGWLGHELGHILDYKDRSSLNLVLFGLRYHFFPSFLKKAEITADRNAVRAGLTKELVISKRFGREPAVFSSSYIDKLNRLYPSVRDVLNWSERLEETSQRLVR